MRKILIVLLLLVASGCSKAHSDASGGAGAHAIQIPSNDGSICYAIVDGSGATVGGNFR